MLPPQNYLAWKVYIMALHTVAISVTVVRTRIRWKVLTLWWDDYLAAVAALLDLALAVTFWLTTGTHGAGSAMLLNATHTGLLNFTLYFSTFWTGRICLALSIARPFFFSCSIFNCVLLGSLCLWSPSIYPPGTILLEGYKNCQPGNLRYNIAGGIMTAVELLSDIVGIVVPLKFLWHISLPTNERRLVHGAISATLLAALSGVVTCVFWFLVHKIGKDFPIVMEGAALSVTVCNLLVVVTYWWRKVHRGNRPTRRHRHNDPNIPTSKTSSQSPSTASGSRSDNGGNGVDFFTDTRRSPYLEGSSQLPDGLTFTPITPLSAESTSNPIWAQHGRAQADMVTHSLVTDVADYPRAPAFGEHPPSPPSSHIRNYK
ncbi:hypothetical protein BKA70DRAFT_1557117 [Coprinopsis sp. MPI-PUGE-AT-0042]|nr:hypothetical protein BKA70DRAFT_1557117 [Coprinopsis sp. MPI-PUGE-AT-0042]